MLGWQGKERKPGDDIIRVIGGANRPREGRREGGREGGPGMRQNAHIPTFMSLAHCRDSRPTDEATGDGKETAAILLIPFPALSLARRHHILFMATQG